MTYRISRRSLLAAAAAFSTIPSAVATPPSAGQTYTNTPEGRLLSRHRRPPDWGERAGANDSWVMADGLHVQASDKVFQNLPAAWQVLPVLIFIDFEESIYWNKERLSLGALEQRLAKGAPKTVYIAWEDYPIRMNICWVVWLFNDAGVTPIRVQMKDKAKPIPRSEFEAIHGKVP